MKPEHFIKIRRHENCEECDYLSDEGDKLRIIPICTRHDFTLPSRTNDYRCEDFMEIQCSANYERI